MASRNSALPSPARSGALKMLPTPVSCTDAGAGIERHLVGRAVEEIGIGPEDVLGAVAVVDVEIDDRHAFGAMAGAGIMGGNRHLVEQAETHGAAGSRRGGRAGARRRRHCRPRPRTPASTAAVAAPTAAERRLKAAGRHHRIGIEIFEALLGGHRTDAVEMLGRMGAEDVLVAAERRFAAQEVVEMVAESRIWLIALIRSTRSGWPSGVTWGSEAGWVKSAVVMGPLVARLASGLL